MDDENKENIKNEEYRGEENYPPSVRGEESISGDLPDPASDDDILENEHEVGLSLDEDPEHPKEVDVGSDLDKAEEYERQH